MSRESHHKFCETRFQNIEEEVEDIQQKLGDMYYGPTK